MLKWVKANLHTRWSAKLLLYQAFVWVRDNLYSRWSFNLLIWHGFRIILRIFIFCFFGEAILSKFHPEYLLFATTIIFYIPTHIIVFAPAMIMLYLEKKREIRIDRKILDNNNIFIPYFILSIPALILELLWIIIAFLGIFLPFLYALITLFKDNPFEYWFYIISPDFYKALFLFFI